MRVHLNYGLCSGILGSLGLLLASSTFAGDIDLFSQKRDSNLENVVHGNNEHQKSDVAQINVSSIDRFLSNYVTDLLENNFDETYKKYSSDLDRLGLIDLIILNDFNYESTYKTTDELASDFMKMFNQNISAIGLIGMKISPKILLSFEPMAEKRFKNNTKFLVFLAVFLKTLAPEIALTVKENSRSQQWVDIPNKLICSQTVDELVAKIYSISEKLLNIAKENEKNPEVLKKIFDVRERLFVKSGSFKNREIVDKRLQSYEDLLNKHGEYINSLGNKEFLDSEKKKYSKRSNSVVDYKGVIAAKDSELQREFHQKSIKRAINVLIENFFVAKEDLDVVSQIFNMAINASIKINDKVDFLSKKNSDRLIDSLCKENFANSLKHIRLGNAFNSQILEDFVNKHIEPSGLNSLVELVTGDKNSPGIMTQEFSNAIRSEVRADVLEKVYSEISLDMIIGLPAILQSYFDNPSFKRQDYDRMIAFGGLLTLLMAETAQSTTERMYNINPELSKGFFRDKKGYITTLIFDCSKEIAETLVKNSSRSKYAEFIKNVEKRLVSKRTQYQSGAISSKKYQDDQLAIIITEIEKIKDIKKAFGGNLKNRIKNIFNRKNESTATKLQKAVSGKTNIKVNSRVK